jgi:hypothetical protein
MLAAPCGGKQTQITGKGRLGGGLETMPSRFPGPTYSCVRCGAVAKVIRLSVRDLRHAGYEAWKPGLARVRRESLPVMLCASPHQFTYVWSAPYRPTTCRILPPAETDGASRTTLTAAASSQT